MLALNIPSFLSREREGGGSGGEPGIIENEMGIRCLTRQLKLVLEDQIVIFE